jgi:hypothetical protein
MFTNTTTTGEKMKFGIDWSQNSTKRGAVWAAGSLIALVFLSVSSVEKALAVMSITGTLAGAIGLAIKD